MTHKLSKFIVFTEPMCDQRARSWNRVVFSTRSGSIRLLSAKTWEALAKGKFEEVPDAIRFILQVEEFLVPTDENELRTILAANSAAQRTTKSAYLVIQPSAGCQFGCPYCGQKHSGKVICLEHQVKLVDRARKMLSTGKYELIEVAWFGGEPTTALNSMRDLSIRLKTAALENGCGYLAKIVTNGFRLTDEVVHSLVNEMDIASIEVTLDGTREEHDRSRPTKGGGPTFDRVFGNIISIARRDDIQVKLTIRSNVSRSNRESILSLLELLAAEGVQSKIHVYAAPLHDWGNSARVDFGTSMKDYADWEVQYLIRALQLGFRPTLLPSRKHINCMTFMPGAEMIDAYGNRFNCTEVSYVPSYEISSSQSKLPLLSIAETKVRSNKYAIGHLDQSDDIPGRREILGNFYDDVERGRFDCHECPMLPTCGGGCPKTWVEGTPACPAPKFNITQRLQIIYATSKLKNEE